MRISDWSSDVCSSDLAGGIAPLRLGEQRLGLGAQPGGLVEFAARIGDPGVERVAQPMMGAAEPEDADDEDRQADIDPALGVEAGQDWKRVGEGKGVAVRVALGGRRIIKKKTKNEQHL